MLLLVLFVARQLFLALHPLLAQIRLLRAVSLVLWLWLGVPVVHALKSGRPVPLVLASSSSMPRCCTRIHDEFRPSYASVLVHGPDPLALQNAVHDLEHNHRITSCFTAWCSHCQAPYLLTTDINEFKTPSAHHTHQLLLLSILRESGAFGPAEPAEL
jgi:hypothetical protein